MFLPILVTIITVSIIILIVLSITRKDKENWLHFFATGKDAGFSIKEIEMLRKLAVKSELKEPTALFFSLNQLEMCIRAFVKTLNVTGTINDPENQRLLSKLYDYRKKVEMEKPRIKRGITSSRQISDGQTLRILVPDVAVVESQIIKNTSGFITITRPSSNKLPGSFSWTGANISVYFWRNEDAGYVFDTYVIDEIFSKGLSSLKINHGEKLFRTQKRKSVRLKLHKPAYLYLLDKEDAFYIVETWPGLKCYMEDLSDTGCAVTIGGKARANIRVKIQFALNNNTICILGAVRSAEYKEDLNMSILHIEADPLPLEVRNMILGEVFGMLPNDENDLPFRLLAEEAEEAGLGGDYEETEGLAGEDAKELSFADSGNLK